jgi:hypothetical protein
MKRCVTIFNAYDLLARPELYSQAATEISGTVAGVSPTGGQPKAHTYWVPARPIGPSWHQWRALWLVWTGRADVLHWPGQEY